MTVDAPVRRRIRTRAAVLWVLAAVVLVVLASCAWVGVRAFLAKGELEKLVPLADRIRAAAADRDLDELQGLTDQLGESAEHAASLTGDPVWRAAEFIPWLGDDLGAVRIASTELSVVSADAVAPLVSVSRDFQAAQSPEPGGIDLALVKRSTGPLARAATALSSARTQLATIDRGGLIPQLSDGIDALSSYVSSGADAVSWAADAAEVLPGMLGADGHRNILLMLQNNAELRTGGGITGSFAQLDADAGRLSMVAQADSSDFESRSTPILPVPDNVTALYGHVVGRFVQNSSIPADFGLAAKLASAWWEERAGITPDTVISIDPIVLRSLLAATGPVTLEDGSGLSADNVVQRLLVDPYMTLDPAAQSAFQQQVTSAVFARLLSGSVDPFMWVDGLAEPIADGRVSVWSADESEQAVLAESPLGGPLARHRAAGPSAYAVYLNDLTGAKMDTFLKVGIGTGAAACRKDGRQDVVVSVTMSSSAPVDAAALPPSMTGAGTYGVPAGDIGTSVTVAAPPGSFLAGVRTDGEPAWSADADSDGFASSVGLVTLTPGQTSTIEFRFVSAEPGAVVPTIVHTPLLDTPTIGATEAVCG